MDSLKVVSIVCIFDQATYSKACEIKWRESSKFSNRVLMMGMFPMMTMFMNILFKRFAAADLKDALIRSALVADRSVKMTLRGMCYNQRMPLYKLFYEAVMRLLLDNLAETKELDRENLFSAVYSGDFVLRKTLFYSLKYCTVKHLKYFSISSRI